MIARRLLFIETLLLLVPLSAECCGCCRRCCCDPYMMMRPPMMPMMPMQAPMMPPMQAPMPMPASFHRSNGAPNFAGSSPILGLQATSEFGDKTNLDENARRHRSPPFQGKLKYFVLGQLPRRKQTLTENKVATEDKEVHISSRSTDSRIAADLRSKLSNFKRKYASTLAQSANENELVPEDDIIKKTDTTSRSAEEDFTRSGSETFINSSDVSNSSRTINIKR